MDYRVYRMDQTPEQDPPNYFLLGLHYAALTAIAVLQPLLEQLRDNPEFFVVRGGGRIEVLAIVFCIGFVLPGLMVWTTAVWRRIRRHRGRFGAWASSVHLLLTLLVLTVLRRAAPDLGFLIVPAGILFGGLLTAGYMRYDSIRSFFTYLSPAILIVPIYFILDPRIQKLLMDHEKHIPSVEVHSQVPIVLLVFDEFPLSTLMKNNQELDAEHYPNFARLARISTWYRNGTTNSPNTSNAVPTILTGRYPRLYDLPAFFDHPRNLFTALAGKYELHVFENGESLMPRDIEEAGRRNSSLLRRLDSTFSDLALLYLHLVLPPSFTGRFLPAVDQAWGNFQWKDPSAGQLDMGRITDFRTFLDSIHPASRPALYYHHAMLPHPPFLIKPSGEGFSCEQDAISIPQYRSIFSCHLLQAGFTDRLVGELLDRLETTGLMESALLVVVADHGVNFFEAEAVRTVRHRVADLMLIPFFIKYPHQSSGRISDQNVELVDIVPTIADQLGVRFPWVEGTSILDPHQESKKPVKSLYVGSQTKRVEYPPRMQVDERTIQVRNELLRSDGMIRLWGAPSGKF